MDDNLKHYVKSLEENEKNVQDDARRILLNICRTMLRSPNDDKYREIRLDGNITEKLLSTVGGMECLFYVGYVEDGERIYLPRDTPLTKLENLFKLLTTTSESGTIPKLTGTKKIVKKPTTQKTFFDNIVRQFQNVLCYEDPILQRKAKSVIPIEQLEIAVMKNMRELQKSFKLNDTKNCASPQLEAELIAKDLFLVELLRWFKYEFFKWVNSPICSLCSGECKFESVVPSTDPRCSRVELHRCPNCDIVVGFPRYLHPEPLLTLRSGRCGEWANAFTLLCRSLDYDARFVCDETDHVWTEIWSESNKQWVHVDPCENVISKPLMYERGWKKKLTYVIAYSRDEVQDVTWRYTRDQQAVMARRNICTEQDLIQFIQLLNKQRQNSVTYSPARKVYVTKRILGELLRMLYVPNAQDQDSEETYEGRNSGSLAWRLARGEFAQTSIEGKNYIWDISKYGHTFELRYNIVKDIYNVVLDDGSIIEQKAGWLEGMNKTEGGIIRKVENDWKMVYLARSPQTDLGRIKWSLDIANLHLKTFSLKAKSEVFHGASVSWEIEAIYNGNKSIIMPIPDCNNFYTDKLQDILKLNVIVTLSGGQGQLAWQHAQLFRQSLQNTQESSMIISIQLRNQNA